jgi:hypothetical protein
VFTYKHQIDGIITLDRSGEEVQLRCHWPFDLESDEWIDISNRFPLAEYRQAIRDAASRGAGSVGGVNGGYLHIRKDDSGRPQLDIGNAGAGGHFKSLFIPLTADLADMDL